MTDTSTPKHVFMSYSRRDEAVMRRVVGFLREQGITVWVDNEKLAPGTPIWEEEIEKAIHSAFAVVVVLSPDSKKSVWVRREISFAERYHKRIFPVMVAGDEDSSITLRLITSQYVDIRKNEDIGLNSLKVALLFYLEELEAREQAERKAAEKAERERKEKEQLEREEKAAKEKVEQEAAEKAAIEKAEREAAKKAAKEKAEHEAAEKAEQERKGRKRLEREENARKQKETAEIAAKEKAERQAAIGEIPQKLSKGPQKAKLSKFVWLILGIITVTGIIILSWVFRDYPTIDTKTQSPPPPSVSEYQVSTQDSTTPFPLITTSTQLAINAPEVLLEPSEPISPDNLDQLTLLGEWGDSINQMVFSPDGYYLATLSGKHKVDILDAATLDEKQVISSLDLITVIEFSQNADLIAIGLDDGEVQVWDVASATLVQTFEGHTKSVTVMAFTPNGTTLVTGALDGLVNIWDVNTGNISKSLEGNGGEITALAISPDGEKLAFADLLYGGGSKWWGTFSDNDVNIRIWQIQDNTNINNLNPGPAYYRTDSIEHLEFSQDGMMIISDYRIWDINSGQSVDASSGDYEEFTYLPNGELLLLKEPWREPLQIINDATGEEIFRIPESDWGNGGYWVLSPSRDVLAFAGNGLLQIWRLENRTVQASKQYNQITTFTYSPKGMQIALAISDQIYIKNVKDEQTLYQFGTQGENIQFLAYLPNGKNLAVGSKLGNIFLWSIDDKIILRTFSFEGKKLSGFKFSLDGSYLTAVYENKMIIWSISNEQPIQIFDYQDRDYSFISDKEFLSLQIVPPSSWRNDSTSSIFHVWDITNGQSTNLKSMAYTNIAGFIINLENNNVLYCAEGGAIRVIQISDGSVVQKFTVPQSVPLYCYSYFFNYFNGSTTPIEWIDSLIIIGERGNLNFFQAEDGEYLGNLEVQGNDFVISPDNSLLTVYQNGILSFYGIP